MKILFDVLLLQDVVRRSSRQTVCSSHPAVAIRLRGTTLEGSSSSEPGPGPGKDLGWTIVRNKIIIKHFSIGRLSVLLIFKPSC